jgi:hypothetical protein
MTSEQFDFLQNVLAAYEDAPSSKKVGFVKDFFDSLSERVDKYKDSTFISAKQWGVITRFAEENGVDTV